MQVTVACHFSGVTFANGEAASKGELAEAQEAGFGVGWARRTGQMGVPSRPSLGNRWWMGRRPCHTLLLAVTASSALVTLALLRRRLVLETLDGVDVVAVPIVSRRIRRHAL